MACSFLWCGRGNAHIETAGLVGRTTGKSQRRITLHQGTEHTSPNAHTPPCLARAVSYEDAYRSTLPRAPSAPASHLPSQNRRSFVTTQGMTTGGIRPRSRIYVHYARFEALFTNFRFFHAAPQPQPVKARVGAPRKCEKLKKNLRSARFFFTFWALFGQGRRRRTQLGLAASLSRPCGLGSVLKQRTSC